MRHTIRVSGLTLKLFLTDAITKLLGIMEIEDMQGTGMQLITDKMSWSREVAHVEEALRSHHDRAFLKDCMVHCLKVCLSTLHD